MDMNQNSKIKVEHGVRI